MRGELNLLRLHHRSQPHHWAESGTPQTDQRELQRNTTKERTLKPVQCYIKCNNYFSLSNLMELKICKVLSFVGLLEVAVLLTYLLLQTRSRVSHF